MTELPPAGILAPPAVEPIAFTTREVDVRDTLMAAGIDVRGVSAVPAPQVVTYRVELGPGVAPAKVQRAVDSLSLTLETPVRYAGTDSGAVVVEATRGEREMVPLTSLHDDTHAGAPPTSLKLGRYTNGQAARFDLHSLPHLLVAGTTGSGKSTFLTAMLTSLLLHATPEQVKLVLVDPKRVELAAFAGAPHLMRPIISDITEAAAALRSAVEMMDERYAQFEGHARDITAWNALHKDNPLPRVLIVVDELSDMMMRAGKQVEPLIVRIAQLGRAAGIHLVLATQRPAKAVFSPLIVDNIPARVAFAVADHNASKVALGHTGAEKLAGHGDGLYKLPKVGEPRRFQSAYVSEADAERVVKWWRRERPEETAEVQTVTDIELDARDELAREQAALRAELDAEDPVDADLRIEVTPNEVLHGAGITPAVLDALAETLTERIASGVLAHITQALKKED